MYDQKSKIKKEPNDPSKKYSCPYCGLLLKSKWGFTVHTRKHESNFPFECTECKKKFATSEMLKKHKESHGEPLYPCDKCPSRYRTRHGLRYHKQARHGDSMLCKICRQTFNSLSDYKLHRMTHKDKSNLLQCLFCYKSFSSEKFKQNHLEEIHSSQIRKKVVYKKESKYGPSELVYENKCTICGYLVSSWHDHRNHLFTKHVINQETCYRCAHCSYITPLVKSITTKNKRMRLHLRKHSKVKHFKCEKCNYSAVRATSLLSHVASFHKEKKFDCNFCDKKFGNVKCLTQHIKIHEDPEKKYKCDQCDKSFWSIHKLDEHKDFHDPFCKYLCHICNQIFTRYHTLTQHKAKVHLKKNASIDTPKIQTFVTSESLSSPNSYGKRWILYECFACGHISNTKEGASCCESFQKKVQLRICK